MNCLATRKAALQRAKLRWWGEGPPTEQVDPRVKRDVEALKRFPLLFFLVSFFIFLVFVPALTLPSSFGKIPYEYPAEFMDLSSSLKYVAALLTSATVYLPVSLPLPLPAPILNDAEWKVILAALFWGATIVGVCLFRRGKSRLDHNRRKVAARTSTRANS